jgi:hypothetical protein
MNDEGPSQSGDHRNDGTGTGLTALDALTVKDGDPVASAHIATALTAGRLFYEDGAVQDFQEDGTTVYVEHGRPTTGEWSVEDDRFCSFWPPSYRDCFDLRWIVESGHVTGLEFRSVRDGSVFRGRY